VKTHDPIQGSEGWRLLRMGRPTASCFDQLVSPTWKVREGKMPRTYMMEKLAELYCKWQPDVGSWAMENGSILESEAIPFIELLFDLKVQRVGFVTDDAMTYGASPDGLIGDDAVLEVKCPNPPTHIKYLLDGVVPEEYQAQVQGELYVTGRPRAVFVSYCRRLPPLVVHVDRNPVAQAVIHEALTKWLADFNAACERINQMQPSKQRKTA
jgi:hypothetical protein